MKSAGAMRLRVEAEPMRIGGQTCHGGVMILPFCILLFLAVVGPAQAESVEEHSPKAVENQMSRSYTAMDYTVDGMRSYSTVPGLGGVLYCTGSDSFKKVLPAWAEAFHKLYPGVEVKSTFKKSPDAVPALKKSEAHIGIMSRYIEASEVEELAEKLGYKPSWIAVVREAVAIVVNKNNPIPGLTLKQLDAIFSKSLKRGGDSRMDRWEELGIKGDFGKQKIDVYTMSAKSTMHHYFVEEILLGGKMRPDAREHLSQAEMVKQVAHNPAAIGFCALGAITDEVKALPLGERDAEYFSSIEGNIRSRDYPLARTFVMIFNRVPGQDTDPLTYEFLNFILSIEGQTIGLRSGLLPVSPKEVLRAYRIIN